MPRGLEGLACALSSQSAVIELGRQRHTMHGLESLLHNGTVRGPARLLMRASPTRIPYTFHVLCDSRVGSHVGAPGKNEQLPLPPITGYPVRIPRGSGYGTIVESRAQKPCKHPCIYIKT